MIKNIEEIPYTFRKAFLKDFCRMYKKIKNDRKESEFIENFERALKRLNKYEELVIKNDFLNLKDDREWYSLHWSKNKYYKLKHQSMNKLLNLLLS